MSGIASGNPGQNQTLTLTAASSNPTLIPTPVVSYTSPSTTGTLTFAPVTNTFGTATVTVTVNNGGASNNIITRTFSVTVNPVNQLPTLAALANLSLNENAGGQNINLSGIASGNPGQNQTLTLSAASSNPTLIPTPAVNYTSPSTTGTLTFAPAANTFGTATVTVTVNNGGASNNIVTQTFSVTVLSPMGSVSLSWNPSQSTNVLGYKIYYGTASHVYATNVAVGNVTNITITELAVGIPYYFAATSYDSAGDESTFSNEASYDVTNTTPTPALIANHNRGAGSEVAARTLTAAAQPASQQAPATNHTPAVQIATLTSAALAGGNFSFTVSGSPGQAYNVQSSSNLQDWVSLATNTAPSVFVDPAAAQFSQRFYRLVPLSQ